MLGCNLHAEKKRLHFIFVTSHGAAWSTQKYTVTNAIQQLKNIDILSEIETNIQNQVGLYLNLGSPRRRCWSKDWGANHLFGWGIIFLLQMWQITTNLAVQNTTSLLSYSCGPQKSKMGLARLKSRCWQSCILLGRIHFLQGVPASGGHLHSLVCGPFIHLQSQQYSISLTIPPKSHFPPSTAWKDSPLLRAHVVTIGSV